MSDTTAEAPLPRETGEEQARACPKCGHSRTLIHNADGSNSPAPCPQCFGEVDRDAAVQQVDQGQTTTDTSQVLPLVDQDSIKTPASTIQAPGSETAAEQPLPREAGTKVGE